MAMSTSERIRSVKDGAHKSAMKPSTREVVRRLNGALGATLVSALAGVKDTKASHKWARDDGPTPRSESVTRLRFAYEQWKIISNAEGEHVARVWFIGANPWLDYETPVQSIRDGKLKEVAAATTAFLEDSYSG